MYISLMYPFPQKIRHAADTVIVRVVKKALPSRSANLIIIIKGQCKPFLGALVFVLLTQEWLSESHCTYLILKLCFVRSNMACFDYSIKL